MIVIDASAVLPALVDSAGSGALAREAMSAGGDLHAPSLLHVEVASGLRGRVAGRRLALPRATAALADLGDLLVTSYPHAPLLPRIWELRANATCYDAAYLALAELLDVPLLTADATLRRVPGVRCEVRVLAAAS